MSEPSAAEVLRLLAQYIEASKAWDRGDADAEIRMIEADESLFNLDPAHLHALAAALTAPAPAEVEPAGKATPMSLPNLLSELAALLPERVRFASGHAFSCFVAGAWKLTGLPGPAHTPWQGQATLEAALKEECEARGWAWAIGQGAGSCPYASVMTTPAHRPPCDAASPAEALAAAVIRALGSPP